jgi:DNA-binding MarR family transcriptional regulator
MILETEHMKPRSHSTSPSHSLPDWVPTPAIHYLVHTESGTSIREIARQADVHASTILRQIRRFEARRDDPLVDGALRRLSRCVKTGQTGVAGSSRRGKTGTTLQQPDTEGQDIKRDLRRVLRRMTEPGAILAVARDMEMAVVLREGPGGETKRTATVPRDIAQALALKDWIESPAPDRRVARYSITATGRNALREMFLSADKGKPDGMAEGPARFDPAASDPLLHHMRNSLAESPLVGLSRRRDKAGKPFLSRAQIAAGERLREDFELAALLPGGEVDWLEFLDDGEPHRPGRPGGGASVALHAQDRVAAALRSLGCGLGEVALRVCCHLEGMEALEKRMDWSARSGKIVLRIALTQLTRHYADAEGPHGPMIG